MLCLLLLMSGRIDPSYWTHLAISRSSHMRSKTIGGPWTRNSEGPQTNVVVVFNIYFGCGNYLFIYSSDLRKLQHIVRIILHNKQVIFLRDPVNLLSSCQGPRGAHGVRSRWNAVNNFGRFSVCLFVPAGHYAVQIGSKHSLVVGLNCDNSSTMDLCL